MAVAAIHKVVSRLRRSSAAQTATGLTDGSLLDRFIRQCDHAAFEDLIRRHGPMVLGVCRRVLGQRQDVEDAFQAVFLVLVRKASSIVPRDMVGNWLHGVAYKTAVRVRGRSLIRQHREKQMATFLEPATTEQGWDDLRPLLDEELDRLPARYRSVLVLCDMEGRTRKDVARHLRCPEGTVSTWLARGRELLAQRLTRRGVALGGALAALLTEQATASVPPTLLDSALRCASTGGISQSVSLIANQMVKALAIKKSVVFAGWAVAAILGSATLGGVVCQLQAGQGPGNVETKTPQANKPATPEELVAQLGDNVFAKREEAEKALEAAGAKAYSAVKAGIRSKVPEIAMRCERILPDLRIAALAAREHPLWIRYQKTVGKTDADYNLYVAAVSDRRRAVFLEAAESSPDNAGKLYQKELDRALEAFSNGDKEAEEKYKYRTGIILPISGVPTRGEMAAILFLGTFPATAKTAPTFKDEHRNGLYHNLMTFPRDVSWNDPEGRLYSAWLSARREPVGMGIGLSHAKYHEVRAAIPAARAIASDEKQAVGDRLNALYIVMLSGDKADVALCKPFFKDESVYHETKYTYPDGKAEAVITQVRDVAVAVALILYGEDPAAYEFDMVVLYKERGLEQIKKYPWFCGFRTEAGRKVTHEKAIAFFAKAK